MPESQVLKGDKRVCVCVLTECLRLQITRAQSTLELEQIIRTVTKERLQLERHLAAASEVSTGVLLI